MAQPNEFAWGLTAEEALQDVKRFWSKIDSSGDCFQWQGVIVQPDGYGQFFVNGKRLKAHRAMFELANGPIPEGMCVCHRCDNPQCVNPDHLFLGTHQDNMEDRHAKGRSAGPKGTLNHKAKVTEEDVRRIRSLAESGKGCVELSQMFPIAASTIQKIVRRDTWTHVA